MSPGIYSKSYLMTAGPTPLPPAVSQVMAEPILNHRAPAFIEIQRLPEESKDHEVEIVGKDLRPMMPWINTEF